MNRSFFDKYGVGLIIIVVGSWFLGRQLGIIDFGLGKIITILIGVMIIYYGIKMITNNRKQEDSNDPTWNKYNPNIQPPPPLHEDPTMKNPGYDDEKYSSEQKSYGPTYEESPPSSSRPKWKNWGHDHSYDHTFGEYGDHKINKSTFIGDFHFGKQHWELKPMNLSAFIGDTTIDLTKAQIPYGETRIIISAFIGDIKVFVPNDVTVGVKVQMNAFIGDSKFLDQREGGIMSQVNQQTNHFNECERKILIVVSTFIGDVKVKRVG